MNEWERGPEAPRTEATPVFFAHARPYPKGYVFELHDLIAGTTAQFAVEWSALPDSKRWVPHDLVEFALDRLMPRVKKIVGDRDLVLYFDCLKVACGHPHVLTRRDLEAQGLW